MEKGGILIKLNLNELIVRLLKKNKNKIEEEPYQLSKFKESLFFLNPEEDDEEIIKTIELCENGLKLARNIRNLEHKIAYFTEVLEDLGCYNSLSDLDGQNLTTLINSFVQVNDERRKLSYQMQAFDPSISKLETLREEAKNSLPDIENAETEEKILSRDLAIIKQEQENTKIDRENLEKAFKYTNIFSFLVLVGLVTSIIALSSYSLFKNVSVLMPITILCFLTVLAIALIYLINKKIKFELLLNNKKQARLMTLLNKKTVVYSYYVNFLNFAYSKYGVKNLKNLKKNLDNFTNYKNTVNRYDNLSKLIEETYKSIELFIKEKNIKIKNTSVETFAKSINIENKISYAKSLESKKAIAEEKLISVNKEFDEIQIQLAEFNDQDKTQEGIIARIISFYLKEIENLKIYEPEEIEDETKDLLSEENKENN